MPLAKWEMSISLVEKNISIGVNQNRTLTAIFTPTDACNQDAVWQSRDTAIATIDANGRLTGISNGETHILITSDEGGFQDSCKVTVTDVGIVGAYSIRPIQIYPNPTTGLLRIEMQQAESNTQQAEIYDIYGRKLSAFCLLPVATEINISYLANGIYFLKIGNKTVKFVKE